ncbi:hypothetical protein [Nitratifractor sp.]
MIGSIKDSALSRALALAMGTYLQEVGEVRDLRLDTREKNIELTLLLRGEPAPVSLRVESYEIVEEEGRYYLRAGKLSCSREWIELIAARHLPKLRIEIPARYAKMLKKVV